MACYITLWDWLFGASCLEFVYVLRRVAEMFWKSRALFVIVFLLATGQSRAIACGDSCGDWSGLYNTGGYNLYNFGVDMYNTMDYGSSQYDMGYDSGSWGGSCGMLVSGCGSGYDTSSYTVTIDTYTTLAGLCGGGCSSGYDFNSYGSPYNDPSIFTNPFIPPTNPFVQPSPFAPIAPSVPTPFFPPISNNPMGPIGPMFPPVGMMPPTIPPVTFNPYNPGGITPPPNFPGAPGLPWGGCDNIIVMCPQSPPTWGPPNGPGGAGGTFTPYTNTTPVTPVRIKIPRGVHN